MCEHCVPSVTVPEPSQIDCNAQGELTDLASASSAHIATSGSYSRSAEMGYLNLTSCQNRPDNSAPSGAFGGSQT